MTSTTASTPTPTSLWKRPIRGWVAAVALAATAVGAVALAQAVLPDDRDLTAEEREIDHDAAVALAERAAEEGLLTLVVAEALDGESYELLTADGVVGDVHEGLDVARAAADEWVAGQANPAEWTVAVFGPAGR